MNQPVKPAEMAVPARRPGTAAFAPLARLVLAALLLAGLVLSCTNAPVAAAGGPAEPPQAPASPAVGENLDQWLDPAWLARQLAENPPLAPASVTAAGWTLVDVRTPAEFADGHIPGAVNVPLDEVPAVAASWDKAGLYVLYCRSGNRSGQAQRFLKGEGFGRTVNFGGVSRWTGPLATGD